MPNSHPNKDYLYETHLHTSEASACGRSTGAAMARSYAEAGYAGIIVTDHFFNGNCAISRDLPWADRVSGFCQGYENALAASTDFGLQVFFGWEYNYCGTEFLTYGLDKEFLLVNEDILDWDLPTYLDRVRDAGAMVSQAHPFRTRKNIDQIRLMYRHVDALEILNAGNPPKANQMAAHFAEFCGLPFTAGSDAHSAKPYPASGMAFPVRLNSIQDFIDAVKNRKGYAIEHPITQAD